jgi:hypothetical protein
MLNNNEIKKERRVSRNLNEMLKSDIFRIRLKKYKKENHVY